MNNLPKPSWHDLASDWKVWLWILGCVLVATLAWLLGYD